MVGGPSRWGGTTGAGGLHEGADGRPGQSGAAAVGCGDGDTATVVFGASAQVAQPAGAGGCADAVAVVGDLQGQAIVVKDDGNGDLAGFGVPGAVREGFAGDGEDVGGEGSSTTRSMGPREVQVWAVAELFGVGFGDAQDAGLQPGGVVPVGLSSEDRGADRADDPVKGVDPFHVHGVIGCRGQSCRPLQAHAQGEQFPDDPMTWSCMSNAIRS